MSIADINSKIDQAVAANEAGDPTTALRLLKSAKMLLAATPDSQSVYGTSARWDRNAIDSMIKQLERDQFTAGGAGIRRTKVRYKRVCRDEVGDCF